MRTPLLTLLALSFTMSLMGAAEAATVPHYKLIAKQHLAGSVRWDYLAFDSDHRRLFITRGDHVDVLDVATNKIIGSIGELKNVHGVTLAAELNKGFISDGGNNRVVIFDMTSLQILATVPTGNKPDAIVYDSVTGRVFVANGDSGDMTVINGEDGSVAGTIKLNGDPEFAVSDGQGKIFVNLENSAELLAIDSKSMAVTARYSMAQACERPTGLAIDTARHRLFSTCGGNKTMMVINGLTGAPVAILPIGGHSDAAAYDAGTGFAFSSNGDGTLTIVGPTATGGYHVVQTVRTQLSARTMALDPATHRIYLAAAERAGFDPPSPDHPTPRPHMKPDSFVILTVGAKP